MLSANNPESGTISYLYDNGGNLTSKTDARNITTTYVYDNINRVTQRSYNDGITPTVNYTYDNKTNAIGQLTKVTNGLSTTEYQVFDRVGRVTQSQQTTNGNTYGDPMTYTYNLSGAMIEQKYPSSRVVRTSLDDDGMLEKVESQKNATSIFRNYANNFKYTAAGAIESMKLGNGRFETMQYNSRLQPTQIGLGYSTTNQGLLKLDYDYGTTDNNGNVKSQQITVPTVGTNQGFTAIQTYTYDSLNRIKSAVENLTPNGGSATQTWKQTFTFDRYGNRNFDEENTTTLTKQCGTSPNFTVCSNDKKRENPSISASNNQIIKDQDADQTNDYDFDLSGNTKLDPDGRQFVYDGENKQIQVKDAQSNIIGEYFY